MSQQKTLSDLKKIKNKILPSGPEIMKLAIEKVLISSRRKPEFIKSNFSQLVAEIEKVAYQIYRKEEQDSVAQAFRNVFSNKLSSNPTKNDFFDLLNSNYSAINDFFLSLSQSRKARAGKAFEHIIRTLFNQLDYPYTSQPVINGKPDFLLPSEEHFRNNAMDSVIFTVKRTLKERWRQIVTEGTRGYLFFLATIDTKISSKQLSQIKNHRIYVVVPEHIRANVYPSSSNVISFETFFEQHLDPAMIRWKKNKII